MQNLRVTSRPPTTEGEISLECPECGSHPRGPAAFCTECGEDLHATLDRSHQVSASDEPRARQNTPVNEMVGSERAQWIDSVWCSAARVVR